MGWRERAVAFIGESARRTSRRKFLAGIVGGPTAFSALVLGLVFLGRWLDGVLGLRGFIPSPYNVCLAVPFLGAGIIFAAGSVWKFGRVRGTPVPLAPPPKLVTSGLYGKIRNPMWGGAFILIFGLGLLLNSLSLLLILLPLVIALSAWGIVAIEEPELERRFGQQYLDYKRRVPRFFPRTSYGQNGEA